MNTDKHIITGTIHKLSFPWLDKNLKSGGVVLLEQDKTYENMKPPCVVVKYVGSKEIHVIPITSIERIK